MAQRVPYFPEPNRRGKTVSLYPWDQWFDGNIWDLVSGEDFSCTVRKMQSIVHDTAKRKNGWVETSSKDGHLYIQYHDEEVGNI